MVQNEKKTFVLMLSSGQSPRYRDDIIRVMALPTGGQMQFRYREKHVGQMFSELSRNCLSGCEALVAYLDKTDNTREPEIVPCRFCWIIDSEAEGEFVVVRFEVGEFAVTDEGVDVRGAVADLLHPQSTLPSWTEAKVEGHFLLELKVAPSSCRSGEDRRAWQTVVHNLGGRKDFHDCPFFYNLRGIVEEPGEESLSLSEGNYVLKPDKIYRADITHYTPPAAADQSRLWGRLDIGVRGNGVQALTSQHLSVDSPYDVKRFYFRTTGEVRKQYALFSCGRTIRSAPGENTERHDFELRLEVKGTVSQAIVIVGLIGLSLAVPRWLEILHPGPWAVGIGYLVGGLVAGGLVVFGLRRVP